MSAREIPALSETMDRLLGGVSESQRAEMVRRFGRGPGAAIHPGVVQLVEGMELSRKAAEDRIALYSARAVNQDPPDFAFFAQVGAAWELVKEQLRDDPRCLSKWTERELIARAFRALHWLEVSSPSGHDVMGWESWNVGNAGGLKRIIKGYPGGAPTNSQVSEYLVHTGVSVTGSVKAFDKRVREAVELLELDAIREAIKRLADDGPRRVRVNPANQTPEVWPPRCRGKVPEVAELFSYMADGCGWRRRWESAKPGSASCVDSIKAMMAAEIARCGAG